MTKILNHINTYADLTAYNNDKEKDYPNISYIQGSDEVKWNKYGPDHIVCKLNVTSTSKATKLLGSNTGISYQIIDGVQQQSVQSNYTFDTLGEHIVEYKLDGTSIGKQAFYNCTGITSITIPNSVTSIGYYAFGACTGITSVTIGNGVTSIGSGAFDGCTSLTSITIPYSVTSIGNQAFMSCTGLTSITIPYSVTSIGNQAFYNCTGITSIVVDSANTVYDSRDNCNAIIKTSTNELVAGCKSTVIPNTVTSIGDNAFDGCTSLTSITIPNGVTSIGDSAFYNCTGLTSITIPYSVTSIGDSVFDGCEGLTSIVVDSANTVYDSRNNCNAIINTSTNRLVIGCKNTVIPDTVTSIGGSAFANCTGLTSITIPDSVTSIGDSAFYNCTGLTSITIPDSVTSIGDSVFDGCEGLTSVTIPDSVTSIGDSVFDGCEGLTSVTIEATTPPTLGYNAFNNTNANLIIYVPAESLKAYKTATNWSSLASRIKPITE